MIFDLEQDKRIVVSDRSVDLQKRVERKKGPLAGTYVWDATSYHGNLQAALKFYISKRLQGLTSFKELAKVEEELHKKIDEIKELAEIKPLKDPSK